MLNLPTLECFLIYWIRMFSSLRLYLKIIALVKLWGLIMVAIAANSLFGANRSGGDINCGVAVLHLGIVYGLSRTREHRKFTMNIRMLGRGRSIILKYAAILKLRWPSTTFHLYFDNFFTSLYLLCNLKQQGIKDTGTIHGNRTRSCLLLSSNTIEKQARGSYRYVITCNGSIIICVRNDSASTYSFKRIRCKSNTQCKTIFKDGG